MRDDQAAHALYQARRDVQRVQQPHATQPDHAQPDAILDLLELDGRANTKTMVRQKRD